MKKLFILCLFWPFALSAQTPTSDSQIKTNTDYLIRKAGTVLRQNHALINDQLTDSKVSILAPKLLSSSTAGFVWTATDNLGNGNWAPAVSQFQSLTDGPGVFTSHGLNYTRVNTGATALEYRTPSQVLSDISGVPTSRTLTINGTALDLSADRSWTISAGVSSVFGRSGAVTAQSSDYSAFYSLSLNTTPIKTANYTASANDLVPVDATSGSITITFPTAPVDKTRLAVKMVATSGANVTNLALGSGDHFNTTTGPTTGSLSLVNQVLVAQYNASTSVWIVVSTDVPLSGLDARYASLGFTISTKSTNYTLVIGDASSVYLQVNSSSNINVTVPTNASVAFSVGSVIPIKAVGTGGVTVVASGGVTITASNTTLGLTLTQGMVGTLIKTATDTWEFDNGIAVVGSALTKTDDTNVTLTLGGTPGNSLLAATSITVGWSGQLAQSRGGVGSGNIAVATTGTMNADLTNTSVFTITPTGSCTFNLSGTEFTGQRTTFVITTSGTSSFTMTFGTNFKSTGTLATGTVSGKVFTVEFVYDGTNMNEIARTTAM